jgi:hypothetical protein
VRKYSRQYPVPTDVVEFLLGRYCASTDPAEIEVGLPLAGPRPLPVLALFCPRASRQPSVSKSFAVLMAEAQQGQGPLLHIHRIGVVVQIQRDFSAGELHVQPLADCLEAVDR